MNGSIEDILVGVIIGAIPGLIALAQNYKLRHAQTERETAEAGHAEAKTDHAYGDLAAILSKAAMGLVGDLRTEIDRQSTRIDELQAQITNQQDTMITQQEVLDKALHRIDVLEAENAGLRQRVKSLEEENERLRLGIVNGD